MATDDCSTIDSPCPCGKGKISVEQCTPDHPWARASQVSYNAQLICADCQKKYSIVQRSYSDLPTLVLTCELDAQISAEKVARAAQKKLDAHPMFEAMKPIMIKMIDEQPTKAARHRLLTKMGLSRGGYQSYLKSPFDGKEALRYASARNYANTAYYFDLLSKEQLEAINAEMEKIKKLENEVKRPTPVKTGATWMSH